MSAASVLVLAAAETWDKGNMEQEKTLVLTSKDDMNRVQARPTSLLSAWR